MSEQGSLFDPRPEPEPRAHARRHDPETSHEAADEASKKLRASQAAVLEALQQYGPCIDEVLVANVAGQSPSGIRSRRSELVAQGHARWTGEWGRTEADNRSRIWEAI